MCYPSPGYIIFSLRKLKFYGSRGSRADVRGKDIRAGGRGPDNPNTRLATMFEKYLLNTSDNSASFVIILLPFLRIIFSPLHALFVKRGTTVFQRVILSVTLELSRIKYCFFVVFKSFLQ